MKLNDAELAQALDLWFTDLINNKRHLAKHFLSRNIVIKVIKKHLLSLGHWRRKRNAGDIRQNYNYKVIDNLQTKPKTETKNLSDW